MKIWPKLIVLVIAINLILFVWQNKSSYLRKFDVNKNQQVWKYSQYNVPKNEFRGTMDDPELFSLAGIRYIEGADPSIINFEQQPLAKYFFGISILLFGNAAIIQLIFGICLLIATFLLARLTLNSKVLALIPPLILSLDPLFREQLHQVYLDMFLSLTSVIFLILFYKSLDKPKLRKFAMIILGIVGLSKSWLFFPIILLITGTFLVICNRPLIKSYLLNSIWALVSYFLGYSVYFFYHSPLDLAFLHARQLRLYLSYVPEYPKGEVFRIIFTGWWRKWFDDFGLMRVTTWTPFWPIATASLFFGLFKHKSWNPSSTLLFLWVTIWLISFSLKLVFPRYLLVMLPELYILLIYYVKKQI